MTYFEILNELLACPSVSGAERYACARLDALLSRVFDEVRSDPVGNTYGIRRSARPDAPTLLIDAHFDTIGMVVTGHLSDGFLTIAPVGGLDLRVLQGAEVTVCGRREIYGIVTSTPPHLRDPKSRDTLETVDKLLIDTGCATSSLKVDAPVGTTVTFRAPVLTMQNRVIASPSLDNKACGAAAIAAVASLPSAPLCHTVVLLSACEEIGGFRGAKTGTYRVDPDYAVVLDSNFAAAPRVSEEDAIRMGEGPSVSLSSVTDRSYTKNVLALARGENIPLQVVCEPMNVGTNGNIVPLVRYGIPTVNMSLPLGNMHTYAETISLSDADALVRLLACLMMHPTAGKEN